MISSGGFSVVLLLALSLLEGQAWTSSSFASRMPALRQAVSGSQLSMAAVPIVDEWKVDRFGRLSGVVKNHPEIDDGDIITTSSLADPKAASAQVVVQTKSGSKYKLGQPKNAPRNGMAVVSKKKPAKVTSKAAARSKPVPSKPVPSKPVPSEKVPAKKVVAKKEPSAEKLLNDALRQAKIDYGLNGETVGQGKYLLAGKPQRSTSGKSTIWTAYQSDAQGLPTGEALTVKVSPNIKAMKREAANYRKVTSGLTRGMFVKFYEYLPVAGESKSLSNQCALVVEKADEDLKALFSKRMGTGLDGKQLRDAASAAAQCLQAIHASNLVWTDMKSENFVVAASGSSLKFKGIDLESAMPVRGNPVDYSPEACPPEFAEALLTGDGAHFVLDYSYDVWSFGMLLYELGTGRSYFGGKNPSQITKILKTPGYEVNVDNVSDPKLRDLIQQCLKTNPRQRPSVPQILLHPYFLTTGFGPFSF